MVGDHFRLAISGTLAAQQIVNVFHYRQSTGNTSTLSDVESLARAFDAKFITGSARLVNVQAQAMAWKAALSPCLVIRCLATIWLPPLLALLRK